MFNKIDHIGIAVHSIEASLPLYRDAFGLNYLGEDVVESQGVRVVFLEIGESLIELLEPTRDDSPIAKFLAKNGEGIHHMAMGCDDIEAARDQALQSSIRLLSDGPIDGAHGKLITFAHPKDTGRVLIEFTQRKSES